MASKNSTIDVYPWVHMLGFDIICNIRVPHCLYFVVSRQANLQDFPDNLMFGIDPGTLISGKEHTVMPWLRAWRPTYIYVCDLHLPKVYYYRSNIDYFVPERTHPLA